MNASDLLQVLDVTRRLARNVDLPDVLRATIDAGRTVCRAERGSVFLYDAATEELYTVVGTGLGDAAIRIPAAKGIAGQTAQTRVTINIPDCYADSRFHQETDRLTGFRTRNLLSIPLVGLDDELVGVMQLLNHDDGPFAAHEQQLAEALADQAAVALQRARLMEDRLARQRLEQEIHIARQIQLDVLPKQLPLVPGFEIVAKATPAEETGGDIYDLIPLPDGRLCVVIADATGHGVGPALSVTQARSMLRAGLRLGAEPVQLLTHVNAQLADDLAAARFITLFLGILDPAAHTMMYASAGQAPLILLRRDGTADIRDATTMPLGILAELPVDAPLFSEWFGFQPGDTLLLLTDGFFEAQNPAGEELGTQPLLDTARRCGDVRAMLTALQDCVAAHVAGAKQADDQTAVLLRRLP